ncbi:NAD(P)-binding protein [Thozetella sp. PMI_491]|nr:NAD(P)-binding protein [Thozetella sp. PMI_491]
MAPLVWLVTGASAGIGAALVDEIVRRGDIVIAANRQVDQMADRASENVSLLELDITSGSKVIASKVKEAWQIFGHIDVLVNNAGAFLFAPFEDISDDDAERIFQTNVFGQLHMTRAILPFFRQQGSGTITFTASDQLWGNMPYTTYYNMTKWTNSSFAESLHKEVSSLGIRCVAFECGGVATRLFEPREKDKVASEQNKEDKSPIEAYVPGLTAASQDLAEWGMPPGDPAKVAKAMADVVKGEGMAAGRVWSSRIALGSDSLRWWKIKKQQEAVVMDRWEDVTLSTDRDDAVLSDKLDHFALISGAE